MFFTNFQSVSRKMTIIVVENEDRFADEICADSSHSLYSVTRIYVSKKGVCS
jgi:hypothetical protein